MAAHPRTITRSDPTQVVLEWDDGIVTRLTAAELRSMCPCATCVDEHSGVRRHDPATVPETLVHEDVQLVGLYAITVRFSDGHSTGIFPFSMLREHGTASGRQP